MYLRSIVLKGFKSFPDRTRLEFGPGVSVIVGPNGSGKSNITDAVLWALGEQSPLAVRGQSMQDVIFGGAPGRQGARGAEVELVLDDSEGTLGLGAPEVSIVRRLDRAGEGEYRLAGARCRLVDVIEVLSDTGLGKEMHSVISQGRVESIVTSKPRDRRMLIEEAAGLGKHRKRRRRAQLKLVRTQDNLDRALDVEREARSRLRPLKRQAEAAELHARLERQTLEARWELVRDDLRIHQLELTSAQAAAAEARAERQELERALAAVAARREAAEEALARRSAHREELSRRCFLAQGAAERVGYRADAVRAAAGELEQRLGRTEQHLAEVQRAVAAEPADPRLEAGSPSSNRPWRGSSATARPSWRASWPSSRSSWRRPGRPRPTRRPQSRLLGRRASKHARPRAPARRAARGRARRGGGPARGSPHRRRARRVQPVPAQPGGGARRGCRACRPARGRSGVRARGGRGPRRTPAGRRPGRPIAGGGAARPRGRRGRPCPGQRPRGRRRRSTQPSPAAGAELLADHVRGPAQTVAVARRLLRDTWVVEDLDGLPERFTGVAVTRTGRVWSAAARELRQVAAVGEERVLAERNRRETLIRASEAAAGAEVEAKQALERLAETVSEAEGEAARATDAHRAAVNQRDEAAERERRLEAMIERRRAAPDDGPDAGRRMQLAAELSAARAERDRAVRERTERQARLERLRAAIERDRALRPLVERVQRALVQAGSALAARREEFEQALRADREAGEHVAAELKECAQEEAALHGRLHQAGERLTESEVRLQRVRDRAGECAHELEELARQLGLEAAPADTALAAPEREALHSRLERLGRRREQLGPVNPLAQSEYEEAVAHVEELERQREDLETALRELNKLIADTDRQIRESFEQMFEAAARNFEQVAARLFPGGRGRLRLVAEREGPARVLGGAPVAADEKPDPDEAEDGEPRADAAEEPEEDLLGVEIEITPAGKDMKRLSLLSGGEKSMTALAFLFAVFLARPCPFYILDEVEAALDDLNIDRFLELLRTYSSQAQFIVVTHQKRTMEAADSLYGVSMGADGISKVISRRLPPAQEAA